MWTHVYVKDFWPKALIHMIWFFAAATAGLLILRGWILLEKTNVNNEIQTRPG